MAQILSSADVMHFVGQTLATDDVRSNMPVFTRRAGGGTIGIWVAALEATAEKIGFGLLLPLPIEAPDTEWELLEESTMPDREIEVGYLLKPSAWHQGYASEICAGLVDFAFQNTLLHEVVAVTEPDHAASRRVLGKCGFTDHGMRRAYTGETTDYRMTRHDWEKLRGNDA